MEEDIEKSNSISKRASEGEDEQRCSPNPKKKRKLTMAEIEAENPSKEGEQSPMEKNKKLMTDESTDSDDESTDSEEEEEEEEEEEGGEEEAGKDEEETDVKDEKKADDYEDEEFRLAVLAALDKVEDEDEVPYKDFGDEIRKRFEEYEHVPPIFHSDPKPLNIAGACFNVIDPDKESDSYDRRFFHHFTDFCHREKNLLIFEHPGDARMGGLGHEEGELANIRYNRKLAKMAIKEYHKCNPNASLKLKKVECVNTSLIYLTIFYLTFTAKDKNTNTINKYQAALWYYVDRCELGLMRDVSNDKVLAILKVKGVNDNHEASAPDNLAKAKEE